MYYTNFKTAVSCHLLSAETFLTWTAV